MKKVMLILIVMFTVASVSAFGQDCSSFNDCYSATLVARRDGRPLDGIILATKALDSYAGQADPEALAEMFQFRGTARAFVLPKPFVLSRPDVQEALGDLRRAVELGGRSPALITSWVNMAELYYAGEDRASALAALNSAIPIEPSAYMHFFRGAIYSDQNQCPAAIDDYLAADRLLSTEIFDESGNVVPGISKAPDTSMNPGQRFELYRNLGYCATVVGNRGMAAAAFELALSLNPNDQYSRDMLNRVR